MISVILQVGAVPFGQVSEMGNSDVKCCGSYTSSTVEWHRLRIDTPLPEVFLNEAPPPSPLRRAHSYHFLFPCEPEKTHLAAAPTPTPAHTTPTATRRPCDEDPSDKEEQRLQEAQERLEFDSAEEKNLLECHERLQGPRQESSGSLPAEEDAQETEEQKWRRMGTDLRKIADQFQVNYSKDHNDKGRYSVVLPASFTHGLAASFICLISWRILAKFY